MQKCILKEKLLFNSKVSKLYKRLFIYLLLFSIVKFAHADDTILIQSTTSTKNSGFYDYILPIIKKDIGIKANVVAVGTGAAIKNSMNCDGDILLVHSKKREIEFVDLGFSLKRYNLMYNDFVLIGPDSDKENFKKKRNIVEAFKKIESKYLLFASRGDNSGTHSKEKLIWEKAEIKPQKFSGLWYRETGSGMGATINVAIGMGGYTLSDRATWIKFGNKSNYKILFEGDKLLFNQYGVMLINKIKCPMVKSQLGQKFINWLVSNKGQEFINSYRVNGKQLFIGNSE